MQKIHGTYCAALTPLSLDYSINKELFLEHCNNLLSQDLDGLAVFGTTGEGNSFSVQEKIDAINYLVDNNIGADKLIPGTGLCSIKDTVLYSRAIAKLRVKAVLVLPAFYYKNVSDEGVIEFYRRVVEEVGDSDLKYILYNIPQVSGVSIGFEAIEQLIKLYPNKRFFGYTYFQFLIQTHFYRVRTSKHLRSISLSPRTNNLDPNLQKRYLLTSTPSLFFLTAHLNNVGQINPDKGISLWKKQGVTMVK